MLCYAMLTPLASFAFHINGPTAVCPKGTYNYSAHNIPAGTDYYRWHVVYDNLGNPYSENGSTAGTTFGVTFNSRNIGVAYVIVEAVDEDLPTSLEVRDTYVLTVNRTLPSPATPNGGTIIFCGANETVSVASSPAIPYNQTNPSDIASCLFHCYYTWQAPGGWNFQEDGNAPSNFISPGTSTNTLRSPGSVSNGNNGFIIATAVFSLCAYDVNTSSSTGLWVGTPSISNGQANGSPANSPVYVPGGYANLSVDEGGGGSLNWYIANGSGSLSQSGNYASISFSGFVRVVVESNNRCGNGGSWTFYLNSDSGGGYYRISPNPAQEQVSVTPEISEMMGELIEDVTLYDDKAKVCGNASKEQLKKDKAAKKTSIDLNVKGLARGTYFLHVKMGDEVKKHQIILNKDRLP